MNHKKDAEAFFNSFLSNHVVLYVGQNTKDDEIREYISKCSWSGIITSRRDPELAALFVNEDRTLREFSSRAEIPVKPLNRKKLPILRLFGVQGEQQEDEDLSWLRTSAKKPSVPGYDMDRARDMLKLLPELLDHINPLVIIGADSDIDWKLFGEELAHLLFTATSDGSVSIWGMPASVGPEYAEAYEILKKVAERKKFGFHETSLVDVICSRAEELDQYAPEDASDLDFDGDVYYQGRVPVHISQEDLLLFKNVGTLLTERTINKIRPLGRAMCRKWFSIFLESSASFGPQWYGYLPQSRFYVKRSYEDALVQLVRKQLEGEDITGKSAENRLVVLTGDPGSSKSITLGALAYRVYNERVNPVIFISKDSFLSANIGTGFEGLDQAMQLLERKAPANTRILVIWDSSAYRTGIDQARELMERLQNRGRRFVLVCSSYSVCTRQEEENQGFYCLSGGGENKFETCDESRAQVLERAKAYYVKAIREMNAQEQVEFWKIVKECSGINEATISQFKKKMAAENRKEIFDYYYMLISVLREDLELSLKSEQNKVAPYVENELQKAIGEIYAGEKKAVEQSPVYQAFLAAGFDPGSYMDAPQAAPEDGEDDPLTQNLETFNLCVALFSRFKLSVPYSLAFTLLVGDDGDTEEPHSGSSRKPQLREPDHLRLRAAKQYSESSRNLYRIVTSDIPWIYYGEDENGDFSFRFRNPLEADIFLRSHDFAGEQQIGLVCRIIDIYGTDYRRSRCKDLTFTDNLQALLRLMGPNSGYTPFQSPSGQQEHNRILSQLDLLIDKIENLRDVYGVPDEDAGFASIAVTFIREYYGFIWKKLNTPAAGSDQDPWVYDPDHFSVEDYEYRIKQLLRAISLAEQSVDALENRAAGRESRRSERQHLMNQRNSLAVEIAQCNMRLEDLVEEYVRCCAAFSTEPREEFTNRKLNYQSIYHQLWPVISSNPTNGYAYNALFKAFERMYQKEALTEAKKLQYLGEIMLVVETCETLDSEIVNRGTAGQDELTGHINTIKDFSTGMNITLRSIKRHRDGIPAENEQEQGCFDIYDEMLRANNAAAITFICQKELRFPKGTRTLNMDQHLRCRTVYEFMKEPDNFECISANTYALAMLIRVFWMYRNGTTLTASPECQLTRLNRQQWNELYHICTIYSQLAGDYKEPLIILLYALSALQVSGLSEYGYQEAVDILNTLEEDAFFQRRMRTPFMLCDEKGNPYAYSGTVQSVKENTGFIRVSGVPRQLNKDYGVRFRQYNLGRGANMPEPNDVLSGLELGIGYTGFSVYNQTGRKERGART